MKLTKPMARVLRESCRAIRRAKQNGKRVRLTGARGMLRVGRACPLVLAYGALTDTSGKVWEAMNNSGSGYRYGLTNAEIRAFINAADGYTPDGRTMDIRRAFFRAAGLLDAGKGAA